MAMHHHKIDHVVIAVRDLEAASAAYKKLGFHIQAGGTNGPTENALIVFEDGSYIELISLIGGLDRLIVRALKSSGLLRLLSIVRPKQRYRFLEWFTHEGRICDWCIEPTNMLKLKLDFDARGTRMSEMVEYTRLRNDGVEVNWFLVAPFNVRSPFFIHDVSPRTTRVPYVASGSHPNGARGIHALTCGEFEILNQTGANEDTRALFDITQDFTGASVRTGVTGENPHGTIEVFLSFEDESVRKLQVVEAG